jgi:putative ABC transport system ATP-binding protein
VHDESPFDQGDFAAAAGEVIPTDDADLVPAEDVPGPATSVAFCDRRREELGRVSKNGKGPVVVAEGVTRRYGAGETAVDALRGVSVDVERAHLTAVMGPSGSGKSTLMHILAGLDKPTAGTVEVAGTEITTLGDNDLTKLRREHIGFVFQFFNLLPMLNARENITLPLTIAGVKPDEAWVGQVVGDVGLEDRLEHRPSELSGGQQQRVAIARALISKPTVLFADEPTGNLDSTTGTEILELLRRSVDEYGQTMVMVTHDARAAAMAHRVLFLADGQIVRELGESDTHRILEVLEEIAA